MINKPHKITTTKDFAMELRDYVSQNALNKKELKSFAEMIEFPWGITKFHSRAILTNELVFLNAFIGTVALRACFKYYPKISQTIIDEIIDMYTKGLMQQWLPASMFAEYQQRLNIWKDLFHEFENIDKYSNDMTRLSKTFYEFFNKEQCDEMKECKLILRFNGYMKLFMHYIHQMIEDFALSKS